MARDVNSKRRRTACIAMFTKKCLPTTDAMPRHKKARDAPGKQKAEGIARSTTKCT